MDKNKIKKFRTIISIFLIVNFLFISSVSIYAEEPAVDPYKNLLQDLGLVSLASTDKTFVLEQTEVLNHLEMFLGGWRVVRNIQRDTETEKLDVATFGTKGNSIKADDEDDGIKWIDGSGGNNGNGGSGSGGSLTSGKIINKIGSLKAGQHYTQGRQNTPLIIVEHITGGDNDAASVIEDWASRTKDQASTHFIIDKDGKITQCLNIEDKAWSNGGVNVGGTGPLGMPEWIKAYAQGTNDISVSIEHVGTSGSITEEQIKSSAWLNKYISKYVEKKFGKAIPLDRDHIVGHSQVSGGRVDNGRSTCPGETFPWDRLMEEIAKVPDDLGLKNAIWPTPGYKEISSPFGPRICPFHGPENHSGIDISAPMGAEVHATKDGTVIKASVYGDYGNAVIIDHGDGMSSLYAHNSELLVKEGDVVKQDQVISKVGSTGASTGPHLHFEIRQNDEPQNPVDYVSNN